MRQFYLVVAFLMFFCGTIFSQEPQPELYPNPQKIKDSSWKIQRPRHELQFGIGDHVMYMNEVYDNYYYYYHERDVNWFDSDVYTKTRMYTPAFSATYHYRLLKWLSIGGFFSYAGAFATKENIITEENISCKDHFIAIAPSIRFTYLNRKYVTLYSGLAVSMTWQFSVDDAGMKPWTYVRGQLTGIGVSVGQKWFGFTELGYGNKGIVTAGFGYRFNSK